MKVFGENILDRYDILDPIPESKIFGRKGIPKGRGRARVYSKGARCIIVLTIRERERGWAPPFCSKGYLLLIEAVL